MFNFTSFKSIISKDDISNNAIKLSSIERIIEDSYVFCQKVLGFKSANNPNTLLKTVRINSINDDIYINTKISKINNKKVKFENTLMVSSCIKESKIGVRVFEVNEDFETLLKNAVLGCRINRKWRSRIYESFFLLFYKYLKHI